MRTVSVYIIECMCGRINQSPETTVTCTCGRLLEVVGWGEMPEEEVKP